MAQFTADVRVEPTSDEQNYGIATRPLDAWQLATIEWGPGQLEGFVNRTEALAGVPGTLVINDARIAPDGLQRPKRQGDIETGVAPLSTANLKLQDKGRAFSQAVSTKRANGVGLRGKILRLYEWPAGEDVDFERHLVGTYRLDDRVWGDGYKTLTGLDIRRKLKETILEPLAFKLVTSISETDRTFTIKLPFEFGSQRLPYLTHTQRYSSDPRQAVFYLKTSAGEIIRCPALIAAAVPGQPYYCKITSAGRGALNTAHLQSAISVDADTDDDNLPDLAEWIYIEETLPDLIRLITLGETFDGRPAPDHWHVGMEQRWLDEDSLLYAAPELAALPLRCENYGSTTAKQLIEDEILPFMPATMQVTAAGKIQLRRITTISEVGADRVRFDENVIDRKTLSGVSTKVSHIKSGVAIRAGWDARTEEFGAPTYFSDAVATAANDALLDAEPLILESKLLHSSIHSRDQIRRLLPALAEHYLGEKLVFSVKVKPSAAVVDVGERAHVYMQDVPDDATLTVGTPDIDRSMLVTSVDQQVDGTVYQFKGTSGLAAGYIDQLNETSLTDADYLRNATLLNEALPSNAIQESGGIYYLQPGTHELSFRKKYAFMLGPLYHMTGAEIVCAPGEEGPMFQLWVPHAWHSDSPRTIVTTGKGGKSGGAPGKVGGQGFAVPTVGVGSLSARGKYVKSDGGNYQLTGFSVTSTPGAKNEDYSTGDVPSISLAFNGGRLTGLPADLSGYAGVGGGDVTVRTKTFGGQDITSTETGTQGATNSAGVMIICRGATMAPAARIIVSGEQGPEAVLVHSNYYSSPGSGSGPGTVLFGIDGPFTGPDNLATHVEAYPGETRYLGNRVGQPSEQRARAVGGRSYFEALPHTVNLSTICARTLYIPKRAVVQDGFYSTIFDSLAISRQRDGQIRLIPMPNVITPQASTHPSNGDPGDMAIWQADLDGSNPEPVAFVMTDNYTWEQLDWSRAPNDYATLLLVNRRGGGTISIMQDTRPVGYPAGTHWVNSSDGTEWILGATYVEDQPFRDQGVPVGDELLENGNFSQGTKNWIFTRNATLAPRNVLAIIADQIAQAFISQGQLEGEYTDEIEEPDVAETTVLPPVSMKAVGTGPDEITVVWVQPDDVTGIDRAEIQLNSATVPYTSTSPQAIGGLAPNTQYQVRVRNVGTNGNRSTSLVQNVRTQSEGSTGQLGYLFTDTGSTVETAGRVVSGTVYQDNESIVIAQGREITLTLFNGYSITEVVGAGGAFKFNVPTSAGQLGKLASIYTNNGDDRTRALTEFTYEA